MLRASLSVIGMFLALIISAIKVQAEAWRGIVPLKSTQADVERLIGKPGEHGRYQFDKERAYIHYAGTGPCAKVNRCLCKVSEDTVISIYVELEVEMSFAGLKLDKKHYTKFISGKDPTIATYSNEEIGIIYTVDEKDDDVTAIEYLPTAKDCQDVMRRAKRPRVKKLAVAKDGAARKILVTPCASLIRFNLRDESRDSAPTKYPFINSLVASEFDAALLSAVQSSAHQSLTSFVSFSASPPAL